MTRRLCFAMIPLLAACLLLSIPAACQDVSGGEAIPLFQSDITVNQDGSMFVKETIKAVCMGNEIKRGIYRDFPTRYRDRLGNKYVVDFTVMEVTRDGNPEPYSIENISNGKRVKMGSADVFLNPGTTYTYTLTYKTDRQLGFFEKHDELYWNVTGNGWPFPIGRVMAVVTLPKKVPASDIKLEAYTGPEGAEGRDYKAYIDEYGRSVFYTTQGLGPSEGLTIVVGWPKGIVTPPTAAMQTRWFFRENASAFAGLIGLLIVFVCYYFTWAKVGKDPRKGTIIPLYEPPDGLSPAAMRYVVRMGYDNKCFAAALINMAVKRYLKISEEKNVHTVTKDKVDETTLSPEEQGVALALFDGGDSLELDDSNYKKVSAAIADVKTSLKSRYGKGYFSRNGQYLIPGIALSILTLAASTALMPPDKAATIGFLGVWLAGWSFGTAFLVLMVVRGWQALARGTGAGEFKSCASAGCVSLFALPFLAGEFFALFMLGRESSIAFMLFVLVLAGVNYLFYELMRAPTVKGRALLDQIEGFRMYLSVAEADELNMMNPPEKTPEIFEKYLPYALALGVEQQWAERFARVLEAASVGGQPYQPVWYSGRDFMHVGTGAGIGGFASALGGSISGAIASSSSPPGSSSGFSSGGGGGGGGSSGGGGGGGGGGGW